MNKKEAIEYFGSPAAVARTVDINRQAVDQWGETIPLDKQLLLALASGATVVGGDLSIDLPCFSSSSPQSSEAA